ncbi:MAG: hypothetical protein LBP72_10705 [Dysgonamonadaceae bacterium]|jgi:hypothetical protein|nr:hypothetical protein [Dysgonamonadaceae bacterium]
MRKKGFIFVVLATVLIITVIITGVFIKRQQGKSPVSTVKEARKAYNYNVLPEMAGLLANQNELAVSDISLLASQPDKFMLVHKEWFAGMDWDDSDGFNKYPDESMLNTFAYWLAGYEATDNAADNPKYKFGAYIDWKEETEDIILQLAEAAKNLGYSLAPEQIVFNGDEATDEALSKISDHFSAEGYVLLSLDTDSDSYHLFIIRGKDYNRLMQLAAQFGFGFIGEFI